MHEDDSSATAAVFRWIAIGSILVASLGGVLFPFLAVRWNKDVLESKWFQLLRAFSIGLVCGVAMLHILPDADLYLSRVTKFPMANAAALAGAFVMVCIKELGLTCMEALTRAQKAQKTSVTVPKPTRPVRSAGTGELEERLLWDDESSEGEYHLGHAHRHPSIVAFSEDADLDSTAGRRLMVYAMEGSIFIHAMLIGLGLGVMKSQPIRVAILGLALCFHQFFEGIALGTSGVKAKLKLHSAKALHLVSTFTVSCPLGGVLGIFISDFYKQVDPRTDWIMGILNALAAGTLIHIGFVELLAEDFSEEGGGEHRSAPGFVVGRLVALFCGGLVMAILAVWA